MMLTFSAPQNKWVGLLCRVGGAIGDKWAGLLCRVGGTIGISGQGCFVEWVGPLGESGWLTLTLPFWKVGWTSLGKWMGPFLRGYRLILSHIKCHGCSTWRDEEVTNE